MKKVIRLNERELKNLIKGCIMEFDDWRAQMLFSKGDSEGVKKANDLAKKKYGNKGKYDVSQSGPDDDINYLDLQPEYGNMSSIEKDGFNKQDSVFNIRSPRMAGGGGVDYMSNGFLMQGDDYLNNIKTDKARDFQKSAGNDMYDYYSDAYKNRLKQKASMLGNASSGQDFTPSALNEAVNRVIRKYLR